LVDFFIPNEVRAHILPFAGKDDGMNIRDATSDDNGERQELRAMRPQGKMMKGG
jgi:hypothetical protein